MYEGLIEDLNKNVFVFQTNFLEKELETLFPLSLKRLHLVVKYHKIFSKACSYKQFLFRKKTMTCSEIEGR